MPRHGATGGSAVVRRANRLRLFTFARSTPSDWTAERNDRVLRPVCSRQRHSVIGEGVGGGGGGGGAGRGGGGGGGGGGGLGGGGGGCDCESIHREIHHDIHNTYFLQCNRLLYL